MLTTSLTVVPAPTIAASNTARRFRIGADALKLDALDDEQREDALWFWRYCVDRDLTRTEIETLLQKGNSKGTYSYDSVYQLFTGRREAGIDEMCRSIAELRQRVDSQPVFDGFKETKLAKELWKYCEQAQARQLIGFVFGNMTIGKTTAFEEKSRRDPRVTYVRMPTRGHLGQFLKSLARRRAMGEKQSVHELSDRIIDSFGEGEVLIIDEADQCFFSAKSVLGLSTLDFIRELWDRRRIGIVLVMDHAGRDALLRGPNRKRMGRLFRRRLPVKHLPDVPYETDMALFAESYGLPPAPPEKIRVTVKFIDENGKEQERKHEESPLEMQRRVLKDPNGGLIVWLGILAEAKDMATESKRPITWGTVIKAHATFAESDIEPEAGK